MLNIRNLLLTAAIAVSLVACSQPTAGTVGQQEGTLKAEANGLERRVERFSKPDKYGVVCYQDFYTDRNISCVQVTEGTYNKENRQE